MITKDGEVCIAVRDRGLSLPSLEWTDAVEDDEERKRYQILYKLGWRLYDEWAQLAARHFSGMPNFPFGTPLPWDEFIAAYSNVLRRFKVARKGKDKISRYFWSIRIRVYDEVFDVWKDLARLCRDIDADDFHEQLGLVAMRIGEVCRELHLVSTDKMNAAEFVIKHQENLQRAASARHAENRAMKSDVFNWLDSNMSRFKSKDSAAEAIAGKIAPIRFRAARDWVGEWAKLRPPRRP